jgi:AcrR family transcriptional regulator
VSIGEIGVSGSGSLGSSEDRRARRTRALLSGALIELILERGWEAIGVRELCARADVARSTFYLHFRNKEELLEDGFNALRETIREVASTRTLRDTGRFGFVEGVANHIFENRTMFLALVGGNGGGIVREKFRLLLSNMVGEELREFGRDEDALAHFLSGGFVSLAVFVMTRSVAGAREFSERFHVYAGEIVRAGQQ